MMFRALLPPVLRITSQDFRSCFISSALKLLSIVLPHNVLMNALNWSNEQSFVRYPLPIFHLIVNWITMHAMLALGDSADG